MISSCWLWLRNESWILLISWFLYRTCWFKIELEKRKMCLQRLILRRLKHQGIACSNFSLTICKRTLIFMMGIRLGSSLRRQFRRGIIRITLWLLGEWSFRRFLTSLLRLKKMGLKRRRFKKRRKLMIRRKTKRKFVCLSLMGRTSLLSMIMWVKWQSSIIWLTQRLLFQRLHSWQALIQIMIHSVLLKRSNRFMCHWTRTLNRSLERLRKNFWIEM